jgi:hypothetical protein
MEINEAYEAIVRCESVRTKHHLLRKYGIIQFTRIPSRKPTPSGVG